MASISIATQHAFQLQHDKHFSCNSSSTSVATLNMYFFIIFRRRIATQQPSNCNSTITSIATPGLIATLSLLFWPIFLVASCNCNNILLATIMIHWLQLVKKTKSDYDIGYFFKNANCNNDNFPITTLKIHRLQLPMIQWLQLIKNSVFATRSGHRLQLETTVWLQPKGYVRTQYLQLRLCIDCNSNHCPVATEWLVQC
jgi:hypothetical protein